MRSRCASGCGGSDDLSVFCQSLVRYFPSLSSLRLPLLQFQRPGRGSRTATPAERVRLVVALSETGGTLRCIAVSLEVRSVDTGGAAYSS